MRFFYARASAGRGRRSKKEENSRAPTMISSTAREKKNEEPGSSIRSSMSLGRREIPPRKGGGQIAGV